MYYPYFSGKQYELITVREMSVLMSRARFQPIIEPVREALSGLEKALVSVVESEGQAILVVNPHHGDLAGAGEPLSELFNVIYALRQEPGEA